MSSKVERIRAILSSDGLVGSGERWWSGSKAFDFMQSSLGDGDEDGLDDEDARETSANIVDRNERFVSELSSPDLYNEKATTNIESVQRGLDFILSLALDEENFNSFGTDAFSCFYDVSTTAEEPLRKFALLRTELTAQLWLKQYPSLRKEGEEDEDDPERLIDFMMGVYSLERVGIGHDSKEELRTAISKCSLSDLFGVDKDEIRVKSLPVDEPAMAHSDYISCISSAFYGTKTGINVQLDLNNLLKLLPTFRPYDDYDEISNGHDDESFDEYADTLTLIANVIHVVSNYGELCISPTVLPQEYAYLSNPLHLHRCIKTVDVHLVGEICHCLRVFGTDENDPLLVKGLKFLREVQNLDGSWPTRRSDTGAYVRYHAAMCAVSALNPQRFRGFGPSDPQILDDLMKYRYATQKGVSAGAKKLGVDPSSSSSFLAVTLPPLENYKHIREFYEAKGDSVRGEVHVPPRIYGLHRLKSLLHEKNLLSDNERKSLRRYSGDNNKKFMKKRRKESSRRVQIQDDDYDENSGGAATADDNYNHDNYSHNIDGNDNGHRNGMVERGNE